MSLTPPTAAADGPYELRLIAHDVAGNEGAISTIMVVSNTAPQMMSASLLGLVAGAVITSAA
jgi:hypothetical protein